MATGTILRFDDVRGYGFIQPDAGGEDVFVHANDFGERRHLARAGLRVEYSVAEGDRGLKVSSVTPLDQPARRPAKAEHRDDDEAHADEAHADDLCDILPAREFTAEITERLIEHVPTLTGAQIGQIRQHLLAMGRGHGWVDD